MTIAQSNPGAGYLACKAELDQAIHQVLDSGWYILGCEVEAFESEFAAWTGVRHAYGVGNGTDAIEIALRACGVGSGDAVFTVSHTAVATVSAIERTGAAAVLVDIDPVTYTMAPESLECAIAALTGKASGLRAKAVVPVHLYGTPCQMELILAIARRYGLQVVEDCAQAHGAGIYESAQGGGIACFSKKVTKCGSVGDAAAFSFYPTKNLGALGDGGAVVTECPDLADRVRLLRQYGWKQRYISEIPGGNSRLDELQAAVLRVKLRHLDEGNHRRRQIAELYTRELEGLGLMLPVVRASIVHVFHQYVVRTTCRDDLQGHLKQQGIGTLIHYPLPVHLQPAYRERIPMIVPLVETERAAREVLSLPMYPELSDDEVRRVCVVIRQWAGGKG